MKIGSDDTVTFPLLRHVENIFPSVTIFEILEIKNMATITVMMLTGQCDYSSLPA